MSRRRPIEEIVCEAYNEDPTRVQRVARQMPSDETFEGAALLLKAMADPVRLRILYALTQQPLCVCKLATLLDSSPPAISYHLRILSLSGLVKVRKEGKFACYYLRNRHLEGTIRLLVERLSPSAGGEKA